jgi:hypothetical protein
MQHLQCVTNTSGWPKQDYQLIGNERTVLTNPIPRDFVPQNASGTKVHCVKWITILRHPFSRSLSHDHHTQQNRNNRQDNYTTQHFFSTPLTGDDVDFYHYIPDQQIRWHCGGECHPNRPLGPRALRKATANLDHFDFVLIVEDINDADSAVLTPADAILVELDPDS